MFITDNFLLENKYAETLYHEYAKDLPIIDYHCHLSPDEIANNRQFENLTQIWLDGDHYKWRAMRANGISEHFITGEASDWEKFEKWAATVPYTLRNPLYHWTHLELQRYFGITELLGPKSARAIYERCNDLLQSDDFSTRSLLKKMRVAMVGTTDDPVDDLRYHKQIKADGFGIKILPSFRPDNVVLIDKDDFNRYIKKLSTAAGIDIISFDALKIALQRRVDYFHDNGCRVADLGLSQLVAVPFSEAACNAILQKKLNGEVITNTEIEVYQSAVLHFLGQVYHNKSWVQQLHIGALRNNNTRAITTIGADAGFDSIGTYLHAERLSRFLDNLDKYNQLPKTIVYNLNPADNAMIATMVGNFNDGSIAGKMQYGSGWWFLDQLDGMEKQINTLSNMGLLSRFIGMLTDSRSFLSYPRHEYFRRLLCNIFGKDIEKGLLPNDEKWVGKVIADICYYNAKAYFEF